MNEEEKEVTKWIKNKIEESTRLIQNVSYIENKKEYAKERTGFKRALNLIKKQQKEIERLKEYEYMYKDLCN